MFYDKPSDWTLIRQTPVYNRQFWLSQRCLSYTGLTVHVNYHKYYRPSHCVRSMFSEWYQRSCYGISMVPFEAASWEKPTFCICENKGTDQLRGNREADQRLCFRYLDSSMPLLPKYKFQLSSHLQQLYSLVCVRPGQNPHCWFSHVAAHLENLELTHC